jgi:hypothetical protein
VTFSPDAHVGAILAHLAGTGIGAALQWRGVTVPVWRDDAQVYRGDTTGDLVLLGERSVGVQTSALPTGAVVGDTVWIGTTAYQVRDLRKVEDGLVTVVALVTA